MGKGRFKVLELEDYATAIGYICILWAEIESEIDDLLRILTPFPDHKISASYAANIDIRGKIQILLAVGFMKQRSKEWFDLLQRVLNIIDNELRSERNRNVHDAWIKHRGEVLRHTKKTEFKKPQAFQLEFSTHRRKAIKTDDLWAFVRDLSDAIIELRILWITAGNDSMHRSWLASPTKQYLRPGK